jgi:hypothetical protein
MEFDFDKGVDSLLRRDAIARRRERASSEFAAPQDETHLDADELNAYSENALPTPLRVRFTEHLADCALCRKTLSTMMLAAPAPVLQNEASSEAANTVTIVAQDSSTAPKQSPEIVKTPGWLERLGEIFAPRVLVYAIPALLLFIVSITAFIALRTDRADDQQLARARQEESQMNQAGNTNSNMASINSSDMTETFSNANTSGAMNSNGMNTNMGGTTSNTATTGTNRTTTADQVARTEESRGAPPPSIAPSSPSTSNETITLAAPPPPAPTENRTNDSARAQSSEDRNLGTQTQNLPLNSRALNMNAGPMAQQQSARTTQRDAARSDDESVASGSSTSPTAGGRVAALRRSRVPATRPSTGQSEADTQTARENVEAPTRTVAGRQFRRQGSAWVDTSYRAGRATVNVTRGSEQFRALAADEPVIRQVASQLGGEIIVVIGGRAYRIR